MKEFFDHTLIPLLTSLNGLSSGLWALIGAVSFALLCLCFLLAVGRGRVKACQTFIEAGIVAVWSAFLFLAGFLLMPLLARLAPSWPVVCVAAAGAVIIVILVWIYLHRKKRFADKVSASAIRRSAAGSGAGKYARALLFGGLLVLSVWVIVGLVTGGQKAAAGVALLAASAVMLLLAALTGWRIWYMLLALVYLAVFALICLVSYYLVSGLAAQTEMPVGMFAIWAVFLVIPVLLSVFLPSVTLTFLKQK